MCHCFDEVDDLSETKREAIRAEHSIDELRTEYSADELEKLGVSA
ncbi:hypothetical protein C483_11276 [Natrialba hulunbeirensis JCM 10989]|uniref:Uncharacterized protein n=1 Tax=Natrialba hulunbeirensis JCM 10989 TaxID=1227493 RepID=L9ZZS6_9EURY|nr:hypothetical protein [Natrialba hulunbeirensis]ELY90638.1 hypothetical protein C483_11276 [Natrialba hulunbeirensis JCM 10989]